MNQTCVSAEMHIFTAYATGIRFKVFLSNVHEFYEAKRVEVDISILYATGICFKVFLGFVHEIYEAKLCSSILGASGGPRFVNQLFEGNDSGICFKVLLSLVQEICEAKLYIYHSMT